MYGGEYRQRDQVVEEYESFEDGIEVLCLAKAREKYMWRAMSPDKDEITRAVAENDKTVGVCAWREV